MVRHLSTYKIPCLKWGKTKKMILFLCFFNFIFAFFWASFFSRVVRFFSITLLDLELVNMEDLPIC